MSVEDEEKTRALKLLLFDNAESSRTELLSAAAANFGFISPTVSHIRGSGINSSNRTGFTPRLDELKFSDVLPQRLSFANCTVSDSDFFDSDTGMKKILSDQENMEKEFTLTLQNCDPNVTSCSSWIPVTSKKTSELTMNTTFSRYQSLYTSVGEYIAKRSEDVVPLSDDPIQKKAFFGCDASTPARIPVETSWNDTKMKDLSHLSALNSTLRKQCCIVPGKTTKGTMPWENPMDLTLLYATPKAQTVEYIDKRYYIGSTCSKKIQRLRAEENAATNCQKQLNESDFSYSDEDTTITSFPSQDGTQEWTVEPQELVLDCNKGNRVLLINNSKQVIRFKANFDGNIINVSPINGTVPAKGRIGLRITVLRSRRRQDNIIEDYIIITSGNVEKSIHIKILKDQKRKTPINYRSYILF